MNEQHDIDAAACAVDDHVWAAEQSLRHGHADEADLAGGKGVRS